MPLRELTPEEAQHVIQQGGDPSLVRIDTDFEAKPVVADDSYTHTIASQLKAKAGGLAGGGLGFMGGMAAGAAIGAPFAGVGAIPGATIGGLIGGLGGGLVGSGVGQKIQDEVLQEELTKRLQEEAAATAAVNPNAALATDITAGAIASGFRPSRDVLRGIRGILGKSGSAEQAAIDSTALKGSLVNAAVNPAIQTGISLAQGQGIPDSKELLASAAGGAVFGKQMFGPKLHGSPSEIIEEPLVEPTQKAEPLQLVAPRRFYAGDEGIVDAEVVEPKPPITKEPEVITAEPPKTEVQNELGAPLPPVGKEVEVKTEPLSVEEQNELKKMVLNSPKEEQEDRGFLSNAAELVKNSAELGLKPNTSGGYNGTQLMNTVINKLTPAEQEIYKKAGIEQAIGGRTVSKEDAVKWLEDNTPQAKIVDYGMEGKVSEAKKEYDKMTHEWYDNAPKNAKLITRVLAESGQQLDAAWKTYARPEDAPYKEQVLKYVRLEREWKAEPPKQQYEDPTATSAYSHVSALDTTQPMPEWTTTKSGKNVQRVDVVIPTKGKTTKTGEMDVSEDAIADLPPAEQRELRAELAANRKAGEIWTPDGLHENLPNTLGWAMIQYKTGPKGEKIAVIAEAQSRWGQTVREQQKLSDAYKKRMGANYDSDIGINKIHNDTENHPLLRDYNRLILKAAIAQAKKEGATHIVVSDAETAMMTEGHDVFHPTIHTGKAADFIPDQASGMRLNYDTILPKIAEELTGSKGERVSLGTHKNSVGPVESVQPSEHGGWTVPDRDGRLKRFSTKEEAAQYALDNRVPRSNLIFRNLDGTPKTDVSGRMYQLKDVPNRSPKLFGKKYAPKAEERADLEGAVHLAQKIDEGTKNPEKAITVESAIGFGANLDHDLAEAMKDMLEHGKDNPGMKVKIIHDPSLNDKDVGGQYDPNTNTIKLPTQSLTDPLVILHEGIHSLEYPHLPDSGKGLTGKAYLDSLNEFINNPKSNPHAVEMTKAYLESAKQKGIFDKLFGENGTAGEGGDTGANTMAHTDYGYTNVHEFSADKFRPSFKETLQNQKWGGESIWKRMMTSLKKFLGIKSQTMFDRIVETSRKIQGSKVAEDGVKKGEALNAPKEKEGTKLPPNPHTPFLKRIITKLRAANESVRAIGTPKAKKLADAFDNTQAAKEEYLAHATTALTDLGKFRPEVVNAVKEKHRAAFRNGGEPALRGADEKAISGILTKYYHDQIGKERQKLGMKIENRKAGLNKWYVPDTMNEETINTFVKHSQSERAVMLKRLWAEHIVRESADTTNPIDKKEALENINGYIGALGSPSTHYDSVKFNAIRKAQGFGLPEGMRETDAMKSLNKYSNRAAIDLAMFKHLESDRDVAGMLKLRDPETGTIPPHDGEGADLSQDEKVREAMQWVTGSFKNQNNPTLTAVIRAANNGILGLGTGIRDLAQIPVNMIPYINNVGDIGAILKGLAETRANARQSLEIGATRPNIDKIRFNQLGDSVDNFTAGAQKLGDVLRKWQGREAMENIARDITYSVGKELTVKRITEALAGDKKAINWLKRFGTIVEGDITELEGKALEKAVAQTAKNFVDANQGTYGGSGLPTGIVDSQLAPFLSLQKWSVEKANTLYKDVYTPFVTGENRIPMLLYTLGAVFTGAGIQEINKLLNNRKGQDPEVKEAWASGSPHAIASEIAALLSLSSFGGIAGDALKFGSDLSNSKTPRSPLSFPLATATVDFVTKTSDAIQAINDGENPESVLGQLAIDLMTHNIQSARMVANRTLNSEKMETADKFRDLRVFNELEGKPANGIPNVNPYLNLEAKDFKHATSLEESLAMLPSLINNAFEKANGDTYELKRELNKLKSNSYQTMPNFKTAPTSFMRYLTFLEKTQGEEAANARLVDYITQSSINKIKSSVIP